MTKRNESVAATAALLAALAAGPAAAAERIPALDNSYWASSEWISVPDAPVVTNEVIHGDRAAPGTSCFAAEIANARAVKSVKWMTAGLGVYEVYANGRRVGDDFLKPGFTDNKKTKYSFTYDVTDLVKTAAGEKNTFAAEVSAGWWRDKICTPHHNIGFVGKKSAFRGVLEYTYEDGTVETFGTNVSDWKAAIGGPVLSAAIFDGEEYDARRAPAYASLDSMKAPERNFEFQGRIFPTAGAEVCLRDDLAMPPVRAYTWKDVTGAKEGEAGTVVVTHEFVPGETLAVPDGETLVLDFGQNAAAVPSFLFAAAEGVTLTVRPAEMLNDGNGAKSRGCDGPEGSVYRANLRTGYEISRLAKYTFAGTGVEEYTPQFTFFGYRYLSLTATGPVRIEKVASVPVSSISADMERGSIETGDATLNQFFSNVRWGQLSNYLSVPTD